MAQASAESPKRGWLKAAEVCELAQLQPYVLRTWEMEFSDLGVVKSPGGPRVYRRTDLERVLRIKQLVFGEGLTLAGARRKIEEERAGSDELPFDDEPAASGAALSADTRRRIVKVRDELRGLLAMLSRPRGNGKPDQEPIAAAQAAPARKAAPAKIVKRSATKSKTASPRGRR
jgi:DNA-binding transcriptional MerR regulator